MEDPWQSWLQSQSEDAFRALVRWHLPLVLATAQRWTNGNAALAQDISQLVFIDLARNARALPKGLVLGGWLYRHTCFTAAKALRSERRRAVREKIAAEQFGAVGETNADPGLDEILTRLPAKDRNALLLRFAEGRDLQDVAGMLGISRAAAQKRIERALARVRECLPQVLRSRVSSAAGLAALLVPSQAKTAAAEVETAVQQMALVAGKSGRLSPLIVFFRNIGVMQGAALGIAVSVLVWAVPMAVQVRELWSRKADGTARQKAARGVADGAVKKKRSTPGEVGDQMAAVFLTYGFSMESAERAMAFLKLVSKTERLETVQAMLEKLPPGSRSGSKSVAEVLQSFATDAAWHPKSYPDDILTALELMPRDTTPDFEAILQNHPDVDATVRLFTEIKRRNEAEDPQGRRHGGRPTFARAVASALARRDLGEALAFCRNCGEPGAALEGLVNGAEFPDQRRRVWDALAAESNAVFQEQALVKLTGKAPGAESMAVVDQLAPGEFQRDAATLVARHQLASDSSDVNAIVDWWLARVPADERVEQLHRLCDDWQGWSYDRSEAFYRRLSTQFTGADLDKVLCSWVKSFAGVSSHPQVAMDAMEKIADPDIRFFAACELVSKWARFDSAEKTRERAAAWMREHFTPEQQETREFLHGKL